MRERNKFPLGPANQFWMWWSSEGKSGIYLTWEYSGKIDLGRYFCPPTQEISHCLFISLLFCWLASFDQSVWHCGYNYILHFVKFLGLSIHWWCLPSVTECLSQLWWPLQMSQHWSPPPPPTPPPPPYSPIPPPYTPSRTSLPVSLTQSHHFLYLGRPGNRRGCFMCP